MKIFVTGTIRGQSTRLTYSKGLIGGPKLDGDALAIDEVTLMAKLKTGDPVGPVGGPYVTSNYLASPLAAVFLIREVFDEGVEITGDVPEPPPVPDGAVI